MPKIIAQTLFGKMGEELLLSSQKIAPHKAIENGYDFMGFSGLVSTNLPPSIALVHGQNIKADLILIYDRQINEGDRASQFKQARRKAIEEKRVKDFGRVTEIEITEKDTKIKVSKNNVSISNQPVATSTNAHNNFSEKPSVKSGTEITSPIIGTAYHAPEPGAKKFIEVGKKIKKGDTIMIVEAMKTMNHVPSTADGVVKEICVEDGHPVEFGQTIIILE